MRRVADIDMGKVAVIEVVDLRGVPDPDRGEIMAAAVDAPAVRLSPEDHDAFVRSWGFVGKAGQMRCHTPIIGVRFYAADEPIAEISICWQCNNMSGETVDGRFHREFNGQSRHARKLLGLCKRALGME